MNGLDFESTVRTALSNPQATLLALDRIDCRESLLHFVRRHWSVLEPRTPLVGGWPLEAICEHLEAITYGGITRLLINVPPGFMKSLTGDVFWPAWEWGPRGLADMRYVAFSYTAQLTERDNRRFLSLLQSETYQERWGNDFNLLKQGEVLVSNDKTGWKLASSVRGVGTGERGNRIILDDPHNVKEAESKLVREETVRWFNESMSNRLNDQEKSAIVVIMQRVNEADVSGEILSKELGYEHLMIPMEFDPGRAYDADGDKRTTVIGWSDPRNEDGELAWPERFPPHVVEITKRQFGSYAYAAQYQQSPTPRGGGILPRKWWKLWPPEGEQFRPDGKPVKPLAYPRMEFIVLSIDTALTEKTENDYSACTVWGLWREHQVYARLMLMDAWRVRFQFHPLMEKIIATGRKWKADRLLIEAKQNGISVAQEIVRLCGPEEWGVTPVNVKGDKVARAYSVQHMLENGLIFAPERRWSDMLLDEMASFPKGAYDDMVDTATQAWRHFRDSGMLQFTGEVDADLATRLSPAGPVEPLYDA